MEGNHERKRHKTSHSLKLHMGMTMRNAIPAEMTADLLPYESSHALHVEGTCSKSRTPVSIKGWISFQGIVLTQLEVGLLGGCSDTQLLDSLSFTRSIEGQNVDGRGICRKHIHEAGSRELVSINGNL